MISQRTSIFDLIVTIESTAAAKAAAEPKPAPAKAPANKPASTTVKKTVVKKTTSAAAIKKTAESKAAAKKTAAKPAAKKATVAEKPAAKKAAPKKAAVAKPAAALKKITAAAAKKVAAQAAADAVSSDADVTPEPAAPKVVKQKVVKETTAPPPKKHKFGPTINEAPEQPLLVWVFGEGSQGELGLGHLSKDGKEPTDVTRPRLNPNLDAATVGVVKAAAGGMHSAAITKNNKILTWGVNDQGALGRDTTDYRTEEQKEAEEDDDMGLNPSESVPGEVLMSHFPEGTVFTDICASDSATFVVTQDGSVYGWGTFRVSIFFPNYVLTTNTKSRPLRAFLDSPKTS